jgi:hypothetical protein
MTVPVPTVPIEDRWVKEPELRRYLSLSARTLVRYRNSGLPHVGTYRPRGVSGASHGRCLGNS